MFHGQPKVEYAACTILNRWVTMTISNSSKHVVRALAGTLLALSTAALLGACVVSAPPQRVYVEPPPPAPAEQPAYSEPAPPQDSMQASEPPPPLPDYEQPPCPADGYLWTPGYWAWGGGSGYYWVPGTWVQPPRVGVLWTPGYWAFVGGVYAFHTGYWGPHVGFYGGVNYGYGYGGEGFHGGRWAGNRFAYNRTVNNVNVTNIHNTYNETVINNVTVNKVSYNGGAGGVAAAPTSREREVIHEPHVAPTPLQRRHIEEAASNPALAARANGGRPAIAATPRPAAFNGPGVVGAHGAGTPQNTRGLPMQAPIPSAAGSPHFNSLAGGQPNNAMHPQQDIHPQQGLHPQQGIHPQQGTPPAGMHPSQAGGPPAVAMHPQAGAPPVAAMHPPAGAAPNAAPQAARPSQQAAKPPQQQAAKPPKNDKHEGQGNNK
jgi:WXXGXW repeat (2 copies)